MTKQKTGLPGPVYILLCAICWSFAGVCSKYLSWNAMTIECFRNICCLMLFMGYMHFPKLHFTKGNILAALFRFLAGITLMLANKLTTAANAIMLQYTSPVFIMLFYLFFEHKKPRKTDIIMCAIVLFGCLLAVSDSMGSGNIYGDLLGIASGITFAMFMVFSRPERADSLQAQMISNLMSGVIFLPFLIHEFSAGIDPVNVGVGLFMGFIQFGLAHLLFALGIKKTEAISACLISTIEPILKPIWVFLILGETPGAVAIAGFAVVITAVTVYNVLLARAPQKVAAENSVR